MIINKGFTCVTKYTIHNRKTLDVLKVMFPSFFFFFGTKDEFLPCDICEIAKHKHVKEEIYIEIPPGYEFAANFVCKLKKGFIWLETIPLRMT